MKFFHLVLVALCIFIPPTHADDAATDQLIADLAGVHSLSGHFLQRQYSDTGEPVAQASGNFRLLRPGYFTWEILSPDSQLIVATPEFIWHHDRDLETVTRRPVSDSAAMSPLQVLGGREDVLRTHYQVERAEAGTYVLLPTDIDPGFKEIHVAIEGSKLTALSIVDSLGQRIDIEFSKLDSDSTLSPKDFDFSAPPEADYFEYDE